MRIFKKIKPLPKEDSEESELLLRKAVE